MHNVGRVVGCRLRQLATGSINRRIFGATAIVAVATLAVASTTVAREQFVAASFGTSDALDAFLIAILLPQIVNNVVAGSFNLAFVPTYVRVREGEGQDAAQRIFSSMLAISIGLFALVTVLLAVAAPRLLPLLGFGFGTAKLLLTRQLFYLLLPIVVANGLLTIWASMLNAGERFALAAFAPVVVPLCSVIALRGFGGAWGIRALAFGTVAGFALQCCLLGWALRRQGLRLWPRWYGLEPALRRVLGQYLPIALSGALLSGMAVVDQVVATGLGPGSVAALSYGHKLSTLIIGISAAALGTAVLPYFSRMVAVGDWAGVRNTLKTYAGLILLATVPLAGLLYLGSGPIVRLLFERGAFTAGDTALVARVQAMYVLQIPVYTLNFFLFRLLSSLRSNRTLLWVSVIDAVANVALDYLLARTLGVAGIALATTLVYLLSACLLGVISYRTLRRGGRTS
jgi:putative peptidoglycan lipid II flippase